jgi:predicted RNA-binding Zn-ribbon protein involved in translation (DUF1610 family)
MLQSATSTEYPQSIQTDLKPNKWIDAAIQQTTYAKKPPKEVAVFSFAAKLINDPANVKLAYDVLLAQNKLWNECVEIERECSGEYFEITNAGSQKMISLQAQLEEYKKAIADLKETRSKDRQATKRKNTEVSNHCSRAIKDLTSLKDLVTEQIKQVRVDNKEITRPLTDALDQRRIARIKEAIKKADLWWAHSETIADRLKRARSAVMRLRAKSKVADIQFHRFDKSGTFGVRFSAQADLSMTDMEGDRTSLMTIREATAEELSGKKAVSSHAKKPKNRKVIEIRAGKAVDGKIPVVKFLVCFHTNRPFPTDIPLKIVTVTSEAHPDKPTWNIVFTFSKEMGYKEPVSLADLPPKVAGIDLGWRSLGTTGSKRLRVAMISYGDRFEEVSLGQKWIDSMDYHETIQGRLDERADACWTKTKAFLAGLDLSHLRDAHQLKRLAKKVKDAKKGYANLLVAFCKALVAACDQDEISVANEPLTYFNDWQKETRKHVVHVHNLKQRLLAQRKHHYRNIAARIVKSCGQIGMDTINLSNLANLEKSDGSETDLVKAMRNNRTRAGAYELRMAILNAAKREKRFIHDVPTQNNTNECSSCGHINKVDDDLMFTCGGCGVVHDRDENAAQNSRNFCLKENEVDGISMS